MCRDNVGLLVDTLACTPTIAAYTIFLTNDLTPHVLDEAVAKKANLIVTYHPTPFSALKKFSADNVAARTVLTCASHGIAVYAPHTAWDVAPGGLNDWLVNGIAFSATGAAAQNVTPLVPSENQDAAAAGAGDGRTGRLASPVSLSAAIAAVKSHLGLAHVQVSLPRSHITAAAGGASAVAAAAVQISVDTISVCAGSGASLLGNVPKPAAGSTAIGVYVTGEMSHHEILAASHAGLAVILTHHSKCERPYLASFKEKLESALKANGGDRPGGYNILISEVDADPLTIL